LYTFFMKDRIQRINQLTKEELGKIIIKKVDFPKDVLVTITRVETLPDLTQAKVYISCFPEKMTLETLKILNRNLYFLQKSINQILTMKRVPKITFIREREIEKADRIEELLEEIKKR